MSEFWSGALSNIGFMFLGAAVSFYATIVFERYKRFGDILREIAQARVYAEGYPCSPRDLARAHQKALDYWRFLEGRQWAIDCEGHHRAAAQVGRLVSFAYRTTACVERMLVDQQKGSSIDVYLSAFQSEFGRIRDREFLRFEEKLRPSIWALCRPFPQPVLPKRRDAILVDFFDRLL
ncbi:MAG: hypothetical protein ACRD06_08750 [Terriglobia bacterium]